MLSEEKTMERLREKAEEFRAAVRNKDLGVAHNLYIVAHSVAVFMELNEKQMKELFGDWDSDDGTETDTAIDGGLFRRSDVDFVNWQCCVFRQQAYEDIAMRKGISQARYYSDRDYCARCKKRPLR